MSARLSSVLGLALLAALAAGCDDDEVLNPVPPAASPSDAGPDAPPPPPPDAGPWKRAILLRNPIGGPSGNLLVDGDAEHSTQYSPGAQVGWRAFSSDGTGELELENETGGLCRSGLRCAIFEPKTLHLIRGTAARATGNVASIWAKMPPGSTTCKAVQPILILIDTSTAIAPLTGDKTPDADGQCHYTLRVGQRSDALGIYLQNSLKPGTTALLDSAFLGPDDGTIQPYAAEFWAPPPEIAARVQAVVEAARRSSAPPRRLPIQASP
ncbi:MAG: hypothetical protein U0359_28715 [Byssovorax sp.]